MHEAYFKYKHDAYYYAGCIAKTAGKGMDPYPLIEGDERERGGKRWGAAHAPHLKRCWSTLGLLGLLWALVLGQLGV